MTFPEALTQAVPEAMTLQRPTSYDVARRAGVSQSAVSRCFRAGGSVAPATRARIIAAAEALGYQPDAIASGLITKRSNLVAVLISNLTNLYYPEVLAEITADLSDHGIRVLLFSLQHESDIDAMLDQVWRYRVDGVIAAVRLSARQLAGFGRRRVPVVLYNRFGEGEPVASVCCDSRGGEAVLVDRMVASGHRHFGVIGGPADSYVGEERVRGATARLAHHGLEGRLARGAFDYDSGGEALATLWAEGPLDALLCANDLMAIGAIDTARHKLGLDVPATLSIAGFDGVGPAHWTSYQLTTMRQPVRRMAAAAVIMVMERILNPDLPPEVRTFAGQLIEGTSTRLATAT